mgnify:FL=1
MNKIMEKTKYALYVAPLMVAGQVMAELSTEEQAVVTAVTTKGTDWVAAAFGIAAVVVVGFAGISLARKAINRAT